MKQKNPAIYDEEHHKLIVDKEFKSENKVVHKKIEPAQTETIDEIDKKWNLNDRLLELFSDKIQEDEKLKEQYAIVLIKILIAQLILLNLWFFLKGLEVLRFSDTTFNIFITGGIIEVFVLVKIIVTYLFKDDLSDLLKILVKSNNTNQTNNKTDDMINDKINIENEQEKNE